MQAAQENITIILNKPKFAGNVGAVARCAKNMGLEKICVVAGDHLVREEMRPQATHMAAGLVDNIRYCGCLEEALGGFQYIVGTTARTGFARGPVVTPRQMAEKKQTREDAIRDLVDIRQPSRRPIMPAEVAALGVFLCSDAAANICGAALPIDGAWATS